MTCSTCKQGETAPGTTTVTLERGETIMIAKGVLAEVCPDCGEYYLSADISKKVYALAEDAVRRKVEVEVIRFAA